jgi:hypothetical protein
MSNDTSLKIAKKSLFQNNSEKYLWCVTLSKKFHKTWIIKPNTHLFVNLLYGF